MELKGRIIIFFGSIISHCECIISTVCCFLVSSDRAFGPGNHGRLNKQIGPKSSSLVTSLHKTFF